MLPPEGLGTGPGLCPLRPFLDRLWGFRTGLLPRTPSRSILRLRRCLQLRHPLDQAGQKAAVLPKLLGAHVELAFEVADAVAQLPDHLRLVAALLVTRSRLVGADQDVDPIPFAEVLDGVAFDAATNGIHGDAECFLSLRDGEATATRTRLAGALVLALLHDHTLHDGGIGRYATSFQTSRRTMFLTWLGAMPNSIASTRRR